MIEEYNIIVAGVGGQGSILLSHILGNAAIAEGYHVRVAETYGAAMRGGAVSGHIRIGKSVFAPTVRLDNCDLLIGLEPLEGLRVGTKYISPEGTAILNTRSLNPIDVNVGNAVYPDLNIISGSLRKLCMEVIIVDGTNLALKAGSLRTLNIVMLGASAGKGEIPISKKIVEETILRMVPPHTKEMNKKAFELGWASV